MHGLDIHARIAVRTATIIFAEISDKTVTSSAALAPHTELAPTSRQWGASTKSEQVSHSGNKRLKRAPSSQRSPRSDSTPPAAPTMTGNALKANATTNT